jgi:hypothetical protein
MPRNVDAVAVFLIVIVVLVGGYFADHGPWCLANGMRIGVMDDSGIMVVAPPRVPTPPRPPAMPALPQMVTLPQLPSF